MTVLQISYKREEFPGLSDELVAQEMAQKYGYVAVVRFKEVKDGPYTHFGCCLNDQKVRHYLYDPDHHNAHLIYDARWASVKMTKKNLLSKACELCRLQPDQTALYLNDSNFTFCPQCDMRICGSCYASSLPLSVGSSGFGLCPKCKIEVQRAVVGDYGRVPLLPELRPRPPWEKRWYQFWK